MNHRVVVSRRCKTDVLRMIETHKTLPCETALEAVRQGGVLPGSPFI